MELNCLGRGPNCLERGPCEYFGRGACDLKGVWIWARSMRIHGRVEFIVWFSVCEVREEIQGLVATFNISFE